MKYKLIIDKNAEEEITIIAHAPSSLTQQIEDLVRGFSGADCIMGYRDDEMRKLAFSEIECITILDRKVIAIDSNGNRYRIHIGSGAVDTGGSAFAADGQTGGFRRLQRSFRDPGTVGIAGGVPDGNGTFSCGNGDSGGISASLRQSL